MGFHVVIHVYRVMSRRTSVSSISPYQVELYYSGQGRNVSAGVFSAQDVVVRLLPPPKFVENRMKMCFMCLFASCR